MRSAFDKLISGTGLVLAAVLLIGGGLLTWANVYIGNQVDDQLSMQGITMPEGEALASLPEADAAALEEFAGSPLDTGPEARAYADHYILAHMNAASDGRTYQEVSGEYLSLSDERRPPRRARRSPGSARRCSWATPCAACCSTAPPSRPWAPSPASAPSSRSPGQPSCSCSSRWV